MRARSPSRANSAHKTFGAVLLCLIATGFATRASNASANDEKAADILIGEGLRELDVMNTTFYQHETSVDESLGRFYYDCSGFLDYALAKIAPAALGDLPVSNLKAARPLAEDFQAFFRGLHDGQSEHWARPRKTIELQPGDLVTWKEPLDSHSKNTGHVMLVARPPTPAGDVPQHHLVLVIDSTESPHYRDSRAEGQSGLGQGVIELIDDENGEPAQYRWKGPDSVRTETTEISLGRLIKR